MSNIIMKKYRIKCDLCDWKFSVKLCIHFYKLGLFEMKKKKKFTGQDKHLINFYVNVFLSLAKRLIINNGLNCVFVDYNRG